MNIRGALGFLFLIAAAVLFPFGYWISVKLYFVAFFLVILGGTFFVVKAQIR